MTLSNPFRDAFFIYRHRQAVHVLRSVVALAILFALLYLFDVPYGSWTLVSAVMVMGSLPHVGGVVIKGLQRLLGTFLGALYGVALLLFIHDNLLQHVLTLIGIGFALYITFTSRHGYSALMFSISLVTVVGDNDPDITIGIWRAINVLVGTGVAILVTALVLPQRATDAARFLLADNIDKLNRLYQICITDSTFDSELKLKMIKTVSAQFATQRSLSDAVHQEGDIKRNTLADILLTEQRMISTVELLQETLWDTRDGYEVVEQLEGLRDEQRTLSEQLSVVAHQVRTGQPITAKVTPFSLQRYAERALHCQTQNGRWLYSPSGYLWLNRELAIATERLITTLNTVRRLPSRRLSRRAHRAHLIEDGHNTPSS
ncbi:Inner membrane protein YeeA [Carnimonas sp. R-84981]|uniref:FUSC family protein n=1 Tax=Carnimonas bestiolae TaxID=3402172 RepID=UPI003EDCA545